jgi:hypothetical protein
LVDSLDAPSRSIQSKQQGETANPPAGTPPKDLAAAQTAELNALKTEIANAERQLDVDEKRLDALRARAADIQLFVTILLGLGTLYAAAQALFAYLNTQSFVKSARDEVSEAIKAINEKGVRLTEDHKAEWKAFQAECRKQFPRFLGMENVMSSVFAELVSIFTDREVTKNLFGSMSPEKRQRVFFYEKSLAGLEYLEIQESSEELLQVFRGLGIFYISKYQWEKRPECAAAGIMPSRSDADRGRFYLERALRIKKNDFRILNDQGLAADMDNDSSEAIRLWTSSITANKEQQRAYYDLGSLYIDQHNYEEAVRLLREGTRKTNWEESPSQPNSASLYYNLACALSLFAEAEPSQKATLLEEATSALKAALKLRPTMLAKLKEDVSTDLKCLATDVVQGTHVHQILNT